MLEQWIDQNPQITDIPRTIGEHKFTIGGVTETRAIATFHQYKVQRIVDCYQQFDVQQKQSVDIFLQSVAGLGSMQLEIKNRLSRVNNKLVLDISA